MVYMMAPLEEHYDDGFGAVAEAFIEAAKTVAKENDGTRLFWNHLPEIFLVRHAIELFLKSGILILHRRLRLPYGAEPHSTPRPMLQVGSDAWKPLFNAHNIQELYAYWKKLIVEHSEAVTALMKYPPELTVPAELDGWINTLGTVDPGSDYFRYPLSKHGAADMEKSPFREVAMDALFPPAKSAEKVRAFVTKDADGNWVRAFKHEDATHKYVAEAGWNAVEMLNSFHAMMRFELTDGW